MQNPLKKSLFPWEHLFESVKSNNKKRAFQLNAESIKILRNLFTQTQNYFKVSKKEVKSATWIN